MVVMHFRECKRKAKKGVFLHFTFGLLLQKHILFIDSFIVKEFMLHECFINIHSHKEITDKNTIKFEYENMIAIEHKTQVEHFTLLGK